MQLFGDCSQSVVRAAIRGSLLSRLDGLRNQAITLMENWPSGSMSTMATYRQRTSEQSELGLKYREYTCDMGVSLSLLNDSWDDGANPWDAVPVVLQVPDAAGRLTSYHPVGESKRKRSWGCVQRGIGSGRQAIVA
jgi:hypothetical protein